MNLKEPGSFSEPLDLSCVSIALAGECSQVDWRRSAGRV